MTDERPASERVGDVVARHGVKDEAKLRRQQSYYARLRSNGTARKEEYNLSSLSSLRNVPSRHVTMP